jgi:hypothetical protein
MITRPRPAQESILLFTFAVVTSGLLGLDFAAADELLRFRLPKAKSVHVKDEATAKSYDKSLKTLGVSSKLHGHDGHFDLSIHCPQWREAEFKTHAEVDKWSKWLTSLGFETKHQH